MQVFDRDPARLAAAGTRLDAGLGQWGTRLKSVPTRRPKKATVSGRRRLKGAKGGGGGGGKDRAREGRTYGLQELPLCDQLAASQLQAADHIRAAASDFYTPRMSALGRSAAATAARAAAGNGTVPTGPCVGLLPEIKGQGKKHWDVIGIAIDYPPTPALPHVNR